MDEDDDDLDYSEGAPVPGARKPIEDPLFRPVDEFDVPKPPTNMVYQWIRADDWVVDHRRRVARGAWDYVPPERHPHMPSDGMHIVRQGMVLVERDQITHDAYARRQKARSAELVQALYRAMGVTPGPLGMVRPEGGFYGTISPTITPQDVTTATEPLTVEVPIRIRLPAKLVTAASVCAITPGEYARRALIMMAQGRLKYMLLPTEDREAFELFDRLEVRRPDDGS